MRKILFICLLWVASSACAQGEAQVAYRATHIRGSIYLLQVPGQIMYDNIVAAVGGDGLLLIDDGFMETVESVRGELRRIGEGVPVRMVVNTHFHHAGANAAFGEKATILAHHAVRERLSRDAMMYGAVPLEASPPVAWPDLTFGEALTLHHGGETIHIRHYPGAHTDGDVVVFFTASNVVATGDLFVPGFGACDVANGCRWESYLAALRRLLDEVPPDAAILPGHGRMCSYTDLEAAYEMLTAMTAHVQAHIEAGRTREALLADGLPERWRAFEEGGLPADFFLSNLFDALSQNR